MRSSWLSALIALMIFALPGGARAESGERPDCVAKSGSTAHIEEAVVCWRLYGARDEKARALKQLGKSRPHGKARARFQQAADLQLAGAYRKATSHLEDIARAHPEWLDVHVLLGRLLLKTGKKQKAHAILDRLPTLYDEGAIRTAADLKWLGVALSLLDYPKDANEIFAESNRLNPEDHELHIQWGNLLLKNHNPAEAMQSFETALEVWPDHPDALVGKARVLFRAANNLPGASAVLERVLLLNPSHSRGRLLQGQIALFLEDVPRSESLAREVLRRNPKNVEAMALLAASAFLKGQDKVVRKLWKRAKKIAPENPSFWHEVARFGERFHRYEEVIPILERALSLDPDYFPALVDLGVAHSRQGDDIKARIFLEKARHADSFDQRAFYMTTELYSILSRDYVTKEIDGVRFRIAKDEGEILIPLFSDWVQQARTFYAKRYDFQLKPPVQVEAFKKTETFAIRAVGTPRFWAHGVCFGHVLAMRSPNTGDFNAREVLVHELAHAYHLQISKGRVPRWFTEGLAELDTMKLHPSLARETDAIMAQRLLEGRMQPICTLSESFVAARTPESLVEAYMQARWVVAWLDERGGGGAILKMLRAFGARKSMEEAIRGGIKLGCTQANEAFHQWLSTQLSAFLPPHPFIPDKLPPVPRLKRDLQRGDTRAGVLLAATAFRKGDRASAEELLKTITVDAPPEKRLLQAEILAAGESFTDALSLCDALERDGHGGFQVALLRARIHTEQKLDKKSLASWKEVVKVHPVDPRPLFALEKAHARLGEIKAARAVRLQRSAVDEHNGELRQSILEEAVQHNQWEQTDRLIKSVMETAPLHAETWRLIGQIALNGEPKDCAGALAAFKRSRSLGGSLDDSSLFGEAHCSIEVGDLKTARDTISELGATHSGDKRLPDLRRAFEKKAKSHAP